jgi:hypothetical protein
MKPESDAAVPAASPEDSEMRRRDFLKQVAGVAAAGAFGRLAVGCGDDGDLRATSARPGTVAHLLPTASSDRILLKASFTEPQPRRPVLSVDSRRIGGISTDTEGLFWAFDVQSLDPDRRYTLELPGYPFEPWELSTLPAPDSRPERLRLLLYTCAGGNDIFPWYVATPVRRRLLRRALEFKPDAVIANGDHVYWDLRAGFAAAVTGRSPVGEEHAGIFDREAPVLGGPNEQVLKRAVDSQIAGLYGTMFRSIPVFFLRDDHDYYEDDQVTPDLITFPPDDFMRRLARATQWLYYPEFLPDPSRPSELPDASASDRPHGISEAFGTLRYGRLFEGLLYDCKGFLTLEGAAGTVVPPEVERWILSRTADRDVDHVAHVPSNPPGWSAGKFAEWYPDIVLGGRLTTQLPKDGWQEGWLAQHDRILAAASSRKIPLFLSGDIHSIAEGLILRSGDLDFSENPVISVITGTPGTKVGWPSVARGTVARPPGHLTVDEVVPVREQNGFHIVDFEPDRVTIRHFGWDIRIDSPDQIDTLEPFHVSEYTAA